jgi:lipoyl synthase
MPMLKQPPWLKKQINENADFNFTKTVLREFGVNTVCQSARCPNIFDCFSERIATFLILGDICTRHCAFCAVRKGQPEGVDEGEPGKIAELIAILGLRHVVITSVTRDDLAGGGSAQFVKTIEAIRNRFGKGVTVEALVPDFGGDKIEIARVVKARADIFSHNLETVPRLYKDIRPEANYQRSLGVLKLAKQIDSGLITKSAIMVGLGESKQEVVSAMEDIRKTDCDMLAIGQYLRPSPEQVAVNEFVKPDEFLKFKEIAYSLGFKDVWSGPFVRSSYFKNSLK